MIIGVRSVFDEGNKYCLQVLLDECLHKSQTLEYDSTDAPERIDVNKTTGQRECIIVINSTLLRSILDFSEKYAVVILIKTRFIITIKCFQKNVRINNINMPYYDRIGVSQGNGVKNTTASKECIIFYH